MGRSREIKKYSRSSKDEKYVATGSQNIVLERVSLFVVLLGVYIYVQWILDSFVYGFYDFITEIINDIKQRYRTSDLLTWHREPPYHSRPGLDRFQILVDRLLPPEYTATAHTVATEDDYYLTIHRLHKRNTVPKAAIFLQHGLLESSVTYLIGGIDSFAFALVEAGFDVWLGNNRGNEFSFTIKENYLYSQWTFHEMGIYDLPAMIHYVLNVTQQPSLTYIGHSQGTAQFIALMSTKPEYQKYVDRAIWLSPAIALNTINGDIVSRITHLVDCAPIPFIKAVLFIMRILPTPLLATVGSRATRQLGFIKCEMTPAKCGVLFSHIPSEATSMHNLRHWFQILWKCGRLDSIYDLSAISIPISIFIGQDDNIMDVEQMAIVCKEKLKQLEQIYFVPNMSHADLTWNAKGVYLDKLLQLLSNYK